MLRLLDKGTFSLLSLYIADIYVFNIGITLCRCEKPGFRSSLCYVKPTLHFNIYIFFLLEIYAKLKSNSVIQAEPQELHFSGFTLGKDYIKILVRKNTVLLVLISLEVFADKRIHAILGWCLRLKCLLVRFCCIIVSIKVLFKI